MRILSTLFLAALAILSQSILASAQTSFVMTFTTGANGSHRTETTETQQSETSFFGISVDADNLERQRRFSNAVNRSETETYVSASENATVINTEVGKAVKQTEVSNVIEYDFADYNFIHSVEFEY